MPDACAPQPATLLQRLFPPARRASASAFAAQPHDATDELLFERVCRGDDHAAYDELLTRYRARVTALVRRMLAPSQSAIDPDDIAQEAFIEAYRRRATFRTGRALRPWLYSIAVNRCLNHLRDSRRELAAGFDQDDLAAGQAVAARSPLAGDPSVIVIRRLEAADLEQAAALLPPNLRLVLILRYFDDLTYEEIAETCHLPLGTVKAQLFRARAELKRRMINRDQPL